MAQIGDPNALFAYKLGTVLATERKVETMLKKLAPQVSDPQVKQGLERHLEETQGQIRNVEQAISTLGSDDTAHQDPVIQAVDEHAEQMLGRVDESLADAVILGGAAHVEHHEIAMYEGLITMAETMGQEEVVALLTENLEQEQHMLREVQQATQKLAQQRVTAG